MTEKKGIIGKIAESTNEIHESSKRKFAGQKESFSERHAAAIAPQPSIKEKFEQEKGAFKERHADAITPQPGFKEKFEQEKEAFKQRHTETTRAANPKS